MKWLQVCGCLMVATVAAAQESAALPSNYRPILDNADVLVQRVHYGPHEFVPMHDHPAVATVFVYLNNSGVVEISHDGQDAETVHRPPTRTGAFRVSPGAFERHSVKNLSEIPSEFLRVELKKVPVKSLPAEFRGAAPNKPYRDGVELLYSNPLLRIERSMCSQPKKCVLPAEAAASVVVTIPLGPSEAESKVSWVEKDSIFSDSLPDGPLEILRIVLPKD